MGGLGSEPDSSSHNLDKSYCVWKLLILSVQRKMVWKNKQRKFSTMFVPLLYILKDPTGESPGNLAVWGNCMCLYKSVLVSFVFNDKETHSIESAWGRHSRHLSLQVLLRSNRIDALLSRLLPHGQLLFLNHRFAQSLEKDVAAYMAKWTRGPVGGAASTWRPVWAPLPRAASAGSQTNRSTPVDLRWRLCGGGRSTGDRQLLFQIPWGGKHTQW